MSAPSSGRSETPSEWEAHPLPVWAIDDQQWMRAALQMAQRGLGSTAPNPSVGAVIVKDGVLVARGWTQPGGRPHAEVDALRRAGPAARGATMYVTLEPCCHQGRSGPCTLQIIAADIARVVAAIRDPNPEVGGEGFARLRAAGIAVETGLFATEAAWLTAGHSLAMAYKRPLVTAKLAVSSDNRIAPGDGSPVWVTGPRARAHGHLLRARADAIVVGRGTIAKDNPSLTCRLPGLMTTSPDRIVLASRAEVPSDATVLTTAAAVPTSVVTTMAGVETAIEAERLLSVAASGAAIHTVSADTDGRIALPALMKQFATVQQYRRILVEGGPTLIAALLAEDLVDEVMLYSAPHALGRQGLPVPPALAPDMFADSALWQRVAQRAIQPDALSVFHRTATIDKLAALASETTTSGNALDEKPPYPAS